MERLAQLLHRLDQDACELALTPGGRGQAVWSSDSDQISNPRA